MATSTLGSGTLVLAGTTSGTTTVTATAVAGTTTLTLPAATDTLVGKATTDTLTNKTLTGAVMNGTLGATTPSTASVTTLTTSSTVTHNGGTANGVGYLDGSKALTTGSALVFDGTNLGVGVTPAAKLDVLGDIFARASTLRFKDSGNTTQYAALYGDATTFNINAGVNNLLLFSAGTERARIDSSGNLLVGTTSGSNKLTVVNSASNAAAISCQNTRNVSGDFSFATQLGSNCSNTSSYHILSSTGGADKFYVFGNGNVVNANNSYGLLSDIKLKENVVDATPKLDNLMKVRIVNYNLKTDPELKQLGVIAQELEQVFAGLVDEHPDRDTEGNDLGTKTKSVKMSVFTPILIKAIQEQQAIITQLQADVAALKGA